MSSILKALKKLEHDNAAIKPGQMRIDTKILEERIAPGISRTVVSLLVILFVGLECGSTYLYMKKNGAVVKPEQVVYSTTPPKIDSPLHKRSIPQPTKKTPQPSIQPTGKPNTQRPQTKDVVPEENSIRPHRKTEEIPVEASVASPTSPTVHITRPVLTINGIAFQEGSSDNLAIINGISVSKGAVIEGVKVEEIRNDRVKFSQNGEKFEIVLNKSNR